MRLINSTLEQQMLSIESKRDDIAIARKILEKALCQQFQLLSLALYSSEILKGKSLKEHDLEEIKKILVSLFPTTPLDSDEDILEYIANGIYSKKWIVIELSDIKNIEIRIFGKFVYLWNTIEINEQLAMLGSDYRIYFAGAMQVACSYIKSLLGYEDKADSIDCRYIFGELGNTSISLGGQVFDFKNELAISPFFNDNVPGFAIGDTAVIRRSVLRRLHQDDEMSYFHTYVHEVMHTIDYSFKEGAPFTVSNWNIYIRRDICRFLKCPHSKAELEAAFKILEHGKGIIKILGEVTTTEVYDNLKNFSDILDSLISERIVTMDIEGNYLCATLQEGQPWDVF